MINRTEDIAALPWHGNHYSDVGLFSACNKFILQLTDREEQKTALHAMAKYGMGIDQPVADADLDEFLRLHA